MADLKINVEDGIATLTMNRPEVRNALSMEMRQLLDDNFHKLEFNDDVRCVVLEGAGDHFMAGGDIQQMHEYLENHTPDEMQSYFLHRIHNLHPILFSMRRMQKPILAKVKGAAAGAGVSLAAA